MAVSANVTRDSAHELLELGSWGHEVIGAWPGCPIVYNFNAIAPTLPFIQQLHRWFCLDQSYYSAPLVSLSMVSESRGNQRESATSIFLKLTY